MKIITIELLRDHNGYNILGLYCFPQFPEEKESIYD